jgi:probable HAF family extracellular repeat protein
MKTISRLIAAGNLLAVLAVAQAPQYSVTDLGVVGPNGQPFVITNKGLISGSVEATAAGPIHAVVWYRGLETDISAALAAAGFTGPNSQAIWVNERAQVAGLAETSETDPHDEDFCGNGDHLVCLPFLSQFGALHLTSALPTLGGTNGVALTINSRGQVAGYAENATLDTNCPAPQKYQFEPVLWTNGSAQELIPVAGDLEGLAWAVNDKGQVAGASGACAPFNPIFGNSLQPLHAILWDADGMPNDLGNLGGTGHGVGIFAKNLNNQGQVVGWSDLKGDQTFGAFIWSKATGMQPLPGPLPGDVSSGALGINDAGVVVGASLNTGFIPTAVIWQNGVNGVMTNLNTLIPDGSALQLWTACSITSRGEIIGIAFSTSDGNFHGYKLTPS